MLAGICQLWYEFFGAPPNPKPGQAPSPAPLLGPLPERLNDAPTPSASVNLQKAHHKSPIRTPIAAVL